MLERQNDKWWVSPFNFTEDVKKPFRFPEKLVVHDVTLRDGEQMAAVIFNKDDKVKIAQALDEVGVDRIEAGNPVISQREQDAIKEVAHQNLKAKVFCLARSIKSDIDLAIKCDVSGVIVYSPASILQIEHKFHWTEDRAVTTPLEVVDYAKSHGLYVCYFPFDTTRANLPFIERLVKTVVEGSKPNSVIMVDTVGCATPQSIFYLAGKIKDMVKIPLEIHCHNDFGLATANTLAGVCAGGEVVHTAVNGLGERAGNAALDEVVAGAKILYGINVNVKLEKLTELRKLVEKCSRLKMAVNKPLTGINAFRFEAGLVIDGLVKHPLTFQPLMPDVMGQKMTILLGKKSGRSSINIKLKEMGLTLDEEKIDKIMSAVKELSESNKRTISKSEFQTIVKRFQ